MKILIIALIFLSGCSTLVERGDVVDGEYIPKEYMKVRGIGGGKFPDGYEVEGKPMIQIPQLPKIEIEN